VAASLDETIGLINEMQAGYVRSWDYLRGQAEFSAADLKKLETLRAKCRKYGGRTRRGRPPDIFLPSLLTELAKVFAAAGGETRVKHGTKVKRYGEFLEFLHFAEAHLPNDLRHSKSAIGSAWQELSSALEKGEFAEIRMGIPGRFNLLITRRRNPKLRTDPRR
jgi:hypothetical protein